MSVQNVTLEATATLRDAAHHAELRLPGAVLEFEQLDPGGYLLFFDGEDEHLVSLAGPSAHIGRSLQAEILLEHVAVSRRHAVLCAGSDGSWSLCDDRSLGGTQLNGVSVYAEQIQLHSGDVIGVGPYQLVYLQR